MTNICPVDITLSSQRAFFLTTVRDILTHCHPLDSFLVPTRLAKAVLPSISVILSAPSHSQNTVNALVMSSRGKKGRKRARGYEGDEVFKLSREVICPTIDDGRVLLTALEGIGSILSLFCPHALSSVIRLLLRNPHLSSAIHSLSSRVLLNILLSLPLMSPASLSPDLRLHEDLYQLVLATSTEIGSGSTTVMSKSLGLIVRITATKENKVRPNKLQLTTI